MLEIECPQCQRTLKVPEKYVGTEGACNYCGGRIEVVAAPSPAPEPVAAAPVMMTPQADPGELAQARAEIEELTGALDSERAERERAEREAGELKGQVAELEAAVATAAQRQEAAARTEVQRLEDELSRARGEVEALNKELEVHRVEKARSEAGVKRSEARLADLRERLLACLEDLPEHEADGRPAPVTMGATPISSDAAALLVGGDKRQGRGRLGWILGLVLVLILALAAVGLFVWPHFKGV